VRRLAEQVKSGRQAEIAQLARWKQTWSQSSQRRSEVWLVAAV